MAMAIRRSLLVQAFVCLIVFSFTSPSHAISRRHYSDLLDPLFDEILPFSHLEHGEQKQTSTDTDIQTTTPTTSQSSMNHASTLPAATVPAITARSLVQTSANTTTTNTTSTTTRANTTTTTTVTNANVTTTISNSNITVVRTNSTVTTTTSVTTLVTSNVTTSTNKSNTTVANVTVAVAGPPQPATTTIFTRQNNCYDARGNKWSTVNLPTIPANSKFTFTYRSGSVACAIGKSSKWGCYDDYISFQVRTPSKTLILPDELDNSITWRQPRIWWSKNGILHDQSSIQLNNKIAIPAGSYLFGYGEDFEDYTEGDNSGTACFDLVVETTTPIPSNQYCFGTRDDTYAKIVIDSPVPVGSIIKITYKNGSVSCAKSDPTRYSRWGCEPYRALGFQIRNSNNQLVYPETTDRLVSWSSGRTWWSSSGHHSSMDVISFTTMTELSVGTYYFGWGDDFDNSSESDNGGATCFELDIDRSVVANFMCFGARDNSWASVNIANPLPMGTIFRLESRYGHRVSCASSGKNNWSRWGCNPSEWLGVQVRSANNAIVAPSPADPEIRFNKDAAAGTWWTRNGLDSNELTLRIKTTQDWPAGWYNIGYGEDFADWTENDNAGKSCFELFIDTPGSNVLYTTISPKLWLKADTNLNFKLDSDNKITQWLDQTISDGNLVLSQTNSTFKPTWVAHSTDVSKSYVSFSGNQWLTGSGIISENNKQQTIIIAFQIDSCPTSTVYLFDQSGPAPATRVNERIGITINNQCSISFMGESCDVLNMMTVETGRMNYIVYRSNNNNIDIIYNGLRRNNGTRCATYAPKSAISSIGSKTTNDTNSRFTGRIYEVIVYDIYFDDDILNEIHRSWYQAKYVSPLTPSFCFGARGDSWANIDIATPIPAGSTLKLTHRSGSVWCGGEASATRWGCTNAPNFLSFQVRSSTNVIIYPSLTGDATVKWNPDTGVRTWWSRPGMNSNDMVLKLPVLREMAAGIYRFGYGEDFEDWTENDNGGRSCFQLSIETPGTAAVSSLKPKLWLRADAGINIDLDKTSTTNQVDRWLDQSGNNNHMIQVKSINKPRYIPATDAGYKSYVQFDGQQWLQGVGAITNINHTVILVYQQDTCPVRASIFDQGGAWSGRDGERIGVEFSGCKIGISGEKCDNHQLYDVESQKLTYSIYRSNNNNLDVWQNGVKQTSATRCANYKPKSDVLYIGNKIYNDNNQRFFGRIYEVIVFDSTITDDQVKDLHTNWYNVKYEPTTKYCFGARDNTWANIRFDKIVPAGSNIILRHRSGTVSCSTPGSDSKWGCNPTSRWLNFQIRDNNNNILVPSPYHPAVIYNNMNTLNGWSMNGAASNDDILKLPVLEDMNVGSYRFGYSDDFTDTSESDNAGTVCFDYDIDYAAPSPAPSSPVSCFGPRGDSWATVQFASAISAGSVVKIKYVNGFVSCAYTSTNTSTYNNWGCTPGNNIMGLQIRSTTNAVILPSLTDTSITWIANRIYWRKNGVYNDDDIINFMVNTNIAAGSYRIGFGEDFDNSNEADNFGKTCFTYQVIPNTLPSETNVCFGARDNSWVEIDFPSDVPVGARIQLTQTSGSVSCTPGSSSFWGCDSSSNNIGFQVRSLSNQIILPESSDPAVSWVGSSRTYWTRSGLSPTAKTLSFVVSSSIVAGRYRFGYGDDFLDESEIDNTGKTCFDLRVERVSTCVPSTSLNNGYAVSTTKSTLCAGTGSDNQITYYGTVCDGDKKIQWSRMRNTKPATGMNVNNQCTFNIGNSTTWNKQWVGECGITPTEVTNLPNVTCEAPAPTCAPADQLTTGYPITTFSRDLCMGDGSDFQVTYFGYICDTNDNRIQWVRMRTDKPRTGLNAGSCIFSMSNNTSWNNRFVGSCGVAPTETPDLPTRACSAPAAKCVASSQLTTGYAVDSYNSDLCAGSGSDNKVTYYGTICDAKSRKIQWHRMTNLKPRTGTNTSTCSWNVGTSSNWNTLYIGSCGIAPILVPDLPTVACDYPAPNCVPTASLSSKGYTAVTFSSDLCAGDGSDNRVTYYGTVCDTVNNKIQWNTVNMTQPRKGMTTTQCNFKRSTTNNVWNNLYVGGCGVAPTVVPDLPTVTCDSPIAQCRRTFTTVTTIQEQDSGTLISKTETKIVNCTLEEALSINADSTSSSSLLESSSNIPLLLESSANIPVEHLRALAAASASPSPASPRHTSFESVPSGPSPSSIAFIPPPPSAFQSPQPAFVIPASELKTSSNMPPPMLPSFLQQHGSHIPPASFLMMQDTLTPEPVNTNLPDHVAATLRSNIKSKKLGALKKL